MKKFFLIISLLTVFTITNSSELLFAQESEDTVETQTSRNFDIDVEIGTQSVWNKTVPIIVKFTPKMDNRSTEVNFDYLPGIEVRENYKNFFPTKKGETVSVEAIVVPNSQGVYLIGIDVISWGDYNYINSERIRLEFDGNLELVPVQPEYTIAKNMQIGAILVATAGLMAGTFFLLKKLAPKFQKWIKPDVY